MKNRLLLILSLVSSFFICQSLKAQSPRLYTMQNGLSSSHINSITQDRQGFIWITSEDGLCRFDGKNFSTFKKDETSNYSLRNNSVLSFFEDSQFSYWVGTKSGLHNFCRTENKFTHFPLHMREERNEPLSIVRIIDYPNDNQSLFIGTSGYGLFKINKKESTVDMDWIKKINPLTSGFVTEIVVDQKERLWVCNNQTGISVIDLNEDKNVDININNIYEEDLTKTII